MKTPTNALTKALLVAALAATQTVRAGFAPIAINPASFNHDPVIEASAPKALNDAVTATMDGGTNKTGNTWYERGYNPAAPTTGIPPAGSTVTATVGGHNYAFQMAPDYTVNNVAMIGHANGGKTPVLAPVTLTVTTPGAFSSLSFLTCSGNGPVLVGYNIHYSDTTSETFAFSAVDWFNNTNYVFNAAGRVSVSGGGVQNVGANPAGACYGTEIPLANSSANVTSIDLFFAGAGGNSNPNNNGRAVVFAISGAKDGSTDFTNTLTVTGFNADAVVEAAAAPTTGSGVAAGSILTNNVTATMDGGTGKANNCWYEAGYYAGQPTTGIPAAGSTFASAHNAATYTMPASYAANNAALVAFNVTNANLTFATPGSYGALSFLGACANGDTFIPVQLQFADGSVENNFVFVPDWFNRVVPEAYLSFGRINPNNRTINNAPEQFVNPFARGLGKFEYRALGLPVVRLFDCVINVTNSAGVITNVALSFTNGAASTRVCSIFAVSGAAAGNVPPVLGESGTPTPGQPLNSSVNAPAFIKRWEGSNNIVLSVTNIAGSGPLAYQWKKAARGGGLRDIFYSFDLSTFSNISDGGRISGSGTSVLTISNALVADSADYLCVVSNPSGSVTSLPATVELLSTNGSLFIGQPLGDVIAPIASDSTPTAESLDHVIDRVQQKWLSDGLQFSGACCGGPVPFTGPVGFVVTPVSGAGIPSSIRFYTANDSSTRDPFDYTLEGSNDGGGTWTTITGGQLKGTLSLPLGRNGTGSAALDPLNNNVMEVDFPNASGYKQFRFSITNIYDDLGTALMQVAEVELLGNFVPAPPVWVRQPDADVKVFAGASPVFGAVASGLGSLAPKYQWYKNSTLISGATSSSYTFANAQLSDSSSTFFCTASNSFGTITSSTATLTVVPAPTQTYPAAILADNPVGYWRLNEGPDNGSGNSGSAAHDYRGGHNGFYTNTVINVSGYNPTADSDTAAQFGQPFAAADSLVADIKDVDFARATNASTGGRFSVEAWVNGINQTLDAAIVTKGYNGILAAGTGTGTEQFALDVIGSPRTFRFLVRDAVGNGYVALSSITPGNPLTTAATWHHLLGVCDQPAGTVSLYVDGVLTGSGTIATNVGIESQPLPMTIGARKSSGATDFDNQWTGVIDDVAIYNTALSASQALAHYYAGQQAPVITLQPTNQTTPENVTVTFYSAAYGAGTIHYQWYLSDGFSPTTPVAGQTSQNLSFTTVGSQNGNFYQLIVTNQYGATTGAVAQLNVVAGPPLFFVDLNASDAFAIGHIMRFHVSVGGTAPFTYVWKKDGVTIVNDYRTSGAQSDTLVIGYANTPDSGNYQVVVSNGQGTTPSTIDAVTVSASAGGSASFNPSGTGWTLQGTAAPPPMGANRLELTSGLGNTARSAFLNTKQNAAVFNASFDYIDTSGAGGADGATFCIQNDTRAAAAVGGGGGSLGYSGITPSVALAINIYNPNTMGIGFLQNGALPAAGAGAYSVINPPINIGGNTDPIHITLSYSGNTLVTTFKDLVTLGTFTTNRTVDIPGIVGGSTAYFGFTGADGGVASTQVISNFTMSPPPVTLGRQLVGNSLILTWPSSTDALLKSTPSLNPPVIWSDVTAPFSVTNGQARVVVSPLNGNQFYRLEVYP
jgi:hypothetical protein